MQKQSTFTSELGKVLENINRTSYASNSFLRNLLNSITGEEQFKPIESLKKGFELKEKTVGSDIIDILFGSRDKDINLSEKILRGLSGFAIDIFADPLTYIGIGGLTKVGKLAQKVTGLKKAGKTIEETSKLGQIIKSFSPKQLEFGENILEQAEKGQRAFITFMDRSVLPNMLNKAIYGFINQTKNWIKNLPFINQALKFAKNLFVFKTGNPGFDELISRFYGYINTATENHIKYLQEIYPKIKKMGEKEFAEIQDYIYGFSKVPPSPEIIEIGDKIKKIFNDIKEIELQKGVLKSTIDNYFTGVITQEALPFVFRLAKKMGINKNEIGEALEFAKEKILTKEITPSKMNEIIKLIIGNDLPVNEIQDEIVQRLSDTVKKSLSGIQEAAWQLGKEQKLNKFFETNPLIIATRRALASVEAIAKKDLIENAKKFGLTKQEWLKRPTHEKAGWRHVKNIKELSEYLFPENIAKSLERFNEPLFNIEEMNKIAKTYKDMIRFWKRMTTTIFPEYHMRNIIGNMWNNWIVAGINNPIPYIRASIIQAIADYPEKLKKVKIKTETGEILTGLDLINEMKELNLLKSGFFKTELSEDILKQYKNEKSLNPLSESFFAVKIGKNLGDFFENNSRITHYIERRIKGFSPYDAANSVKTALFDYNEITQFESKILRDFAFPFYVWSRKNIPLQLKNILMQPEKYSRIAKAKEEIEEMQDTEKTNIKWMPEWMQDSLPIIIAKMPRKEQYKVLLLLSWLPAGDLNKIFSREEFGKMVLTSLEPFSKELIQQITGKDFYFEKDIENYPGEIQNMLGLNMSAKLRHFLRMFRILNFLDQLNPGGMFGKEGGAKSIFGYERKLIDLTPPEKFMKFGFGVRIYPYDIEKGKTFVRAKLAGDIKKLEYRYKVAIKKGYLQEARNILKKMNELKSKMKEE